jgi:hypothetical protein
LKNLSALFKIIVPTFLVVAFASFFLVFSSQAASLAAVYVYLSRIQGGLTSGIELVLAVDTAQNMASGGQVVIEFPDASDTNWCRTAGALTISSVASSQADLAATNWAIDLELPNSGTALAAVCSQGAAGSGDKITITNVGALTAGTTYGVQVSGDTGVLGTTAAGQHQLTVTVSSGAVIDSKTFIISLVNNDQVVVSATVSEAPSVTCTISSNTVNLGTLYPGGAYAIGTHTIGTAATTGYYWAAYGEGDGSTDAGLWNSGGSKLLPSGPTATIDLRISTAEGFGLTVSDPDATDPATVATNFVNTTPGVFGTLDRLYSGAKLLLSQNGQQSSSENATVTYGAKAASGAAAGSYQETVTFICGGYY